MRGPRLVTAAVVAVVALGLAGCDPVETGSHSQSKSQTKSKSKSKSSSQSTSQVKIQTSSKSVCWKGKVDGASKSGCGSKTINVRVDDNGVQVRIQKTKGRRASVVSAETKSAAANAAMARITTAVVTIMIAESQSARSATPSGGLHPPSR